MKILSALFALSLGCYGVRADLIDATITEWFWGASIRVGNYLYISGGETYSATANGIQILTFIIDLRNSWTNQTLLPTAIPEEPSDMRTARQPVLFYDEGQNMIRRYGGWPYVVNGSLPTDMPSELWSTPAGTTSVNWTLDISPAANGLSSDSLGPFAPATGFTNSKFYSFGGSVLKTGDLPNMTVLSGLVTQDFATGRWENVTANIPNQSPYRTQAKSTFVPGYGGEGFFVIVGGENPPTEESFYEMGTFMADMSVITLYDIASGTWYTQTATGDIPPPRSEFCAVGAASSDGTSFEVFVYGGSTNNTYDLGHPGEDGYLSVYTLSLPAFVWFKSTSRTTVRRACHTCSVIGERQMISIGGRLPSSRQALGKEPDPWVSGIGVFDMTKFAWADMYAADAAAYESPQVVKDYYASSYQVPAWSDDALASIFAFTPSPITDSPSSPAESTSGSTATGTGSGSGTGSSTGSTSESSNKSSNAGPIAGGVIAGVAVIAIILGLGYWFGRKRRERQHPPPAELGEEHKPPPTYDGSASTTSQGVDNIYEAPVSKPRHELAYTPKQEYQSHFVELPASSRN